MRALLRRARHAQPLDGRGWMLPRDHTYAALQRHVIRCLVRHSGVPPVLLGLLSRLMWLPWLGHRLLPFWRHWKGRRGRFLRLVQDSLLSGAPPLDAWLWRHFIAAEPHPLPPRATSVLLGSAGDAGQRDEIADKWATAQRLLAAGLAVPHTFMRLESTPGAAATPLPDTIFVKPRHGAAGRHAYRLDIDGADGLSLREWLGPASCDGEWLVQECLCAHADLADLHANGLPPVLRLTLARTPGQDALLLGAQLLVPVPGQSARHFLRGHVHVPVDPATGCLAAGLVLDDPSARLGQVPWNGAPLAGRFVPLWAGTVAAVHRATALWPDLPQINWDVVITDRGPVLLEGNTAGNWFLTCLPLVFFPPPRSPAQLLVPWLAD